MIIAILLISCSAWSSESEVQVSAKKNGQCEDANFGRLDLRGVEINDPGHNAFLLNCSLSVLVPEPDEKWETYNKRMKNKQKSASFLLAKNLDENYRNSHGGTLLMSVVVSCFTDKWKEEAVKILLEKGCDINAVNSYGKRAVDLAKFMKSETLVKILSAEKN